MPIYEYYCAACHGHFQRLVRGFHDPEDLACPRCTNRHVQRLMSQVAVLRSEETRLESLADPSMLSGLDENDPLAIARWAKKLGKELGEEAGEDWDQMVDQMLEEELATDQNETADQASDSTTPAKPKKATSTKGDHLGWG